MKKVCTIPELKREIRRVKDEHKTIGFVPTMGFLHEGHLSLLRKAKRQTDYLVTSIFVNPIQFAPGEDLDKYPQDLDGDTARAAQEGCDLLYLPRKEDLYPPGFTSYVEVSGLSETLCGKTRPGHFRGVTTVVNKLFNLVEPDRAFFGQKDAQQCLIIKKMVEDLDMNLKVVVCPIVREKNGLAMSSRNSYLDSREKEAATVLYRSLLFAERLIEQGERDPATVREKTASFISREPLAKIEYLELVNSSSLKGIAEIKGNILIALAVRIGRTRLIDNMIMEV